MQDSQKKDVGIIASSTIAPEGSVKADSQQRVAINWKSWLTRIDQLD